MINFSEEGLLIAVSYLIPGFLINILLTNALYLEKNHNSIAVFKFLFFSLVNMFFYTLIDKVWDTIGIKYIIQDEVLISFCRNILLPTVFAVTLIFLLKKFTHIDHEITDETDNLKAKVKKKFISFFVKFVFWLGFDKASITSTSWDYIFYELKKIGGSYVIIELKDGAYIYGLFGEQSFATSGKTHGANDLFLEETFEDASFSKKKNSAVYLSQSEIFTIGIDSFRIQCS